MDDDLIKEFEKIAHRTDQQKTRAEIEAYINEVVSRVTDSSRTYLDTGTRFIPEPTRALLDKWDLQNRFRISLQIGEMIRYILTKELLGE